MEGDHLDESPSQAVRRHAATFRKVRQARADALRDRPSDEPSAPEPRVPQRDARSDEVPRAAARLAATAREAGWAVRVVYSRSATGVDAVSVRCRRRGTAAIGYWRAGKFAWGLYVTPSDGVRKAGARELKAVVLSDQHALP